jgi:hypothetical protein
MLLGLSVLAAATPGRAAFINLTPTNGVNSDNSVKLSELVSGNVMGVTVGDKQFSGFNYSFFGDMPDPVDVQVHGFQDQNGNWGVSFHGVFMDLPGGGVSDARIRFIVDIDPAFLEQGYRISDAHLFLNGYGLGGPDSYFVIDESFLESNESMSVFISTLGPGGVQSSDWAFFNPTLTRLHVTKDILASASANSNLPARSTAIDQSFSQTVVPEPLSLSMISIIAFIGFLQIRPRRH